MSASTRVIRKQRPAQAGTLIGVRLQPVELDNVDAWITQQHQPITRPEAIRRLIELGLEAARTDPATDGAG